MSCKHVLRKGLDFRLELSQVFMKVGLATGEMKMGAKKVGGWLAGGLIWHLPSLPAP